MSRLLSDLESILQGLSAEHRKLAAHLEAHHAAMKAFDLKAMEDLASLQEATRQRIATWDTRRKAAVAHLARSIRPTPNPDDLTLRRLAELFPQRRDALLKLRQELKDAADAVAARSRVAGRVAAAVLGHLNTAVRLLAGAVEKAGVYTKHGTPHVSRRIGVMEAVG
jgi:hypothetical protein